MSHDLDRMVRSAVHDLADQARPADLAQAALREGRRRRRRRTVLGVTAVAVLGLAAGATVPIVVGGGRAAVPQSPASPTADASPTAAASPTAPPGTEAPTVLPNGLIVGAVTSRNFAFDEREYTSTVWDRTRQAYVEVPYPEVIPAPVGTLAVVVDPVTYHYGVLDIASGEVRWPAGLDGRFGSTGAATWSPDGRSFAVINYPKDGDFALAVVDAATGAVNRLPQDWPSHACADFCAVGWYDHDTLALPRGHNVSEAQSPTYSGVHLFSAVDGSPEGSLSLPGAFVGADDWSTDGRYVTLFVTGWDGYNDQIVVYDTQTGRPATESRHPFDVWWVSPTQWLQLVDGQLELVGVDATVTATYPLPAVDPARHVIGTPYVVLVQP